MRTLTEDFIGVCQWCLGEYKVTKGVVTLHGYQRPGYGHIIGRCPGVGHDPFEYDKELTEKHITQMEVRVSEIEKKIAQIDAGKVKRIPNQSFKEEGKRDRHYDANTPQYYLPGDRMFAHLLKMMRLDMESEIRYTNDTISYYRERCEHWVRGKIVGIDIPATGLVRTMRDAYDAANEEKRATLDADRAARDAKPGKLMIHVATKIAYPPRGSGDEEAWKAGIEKMYAEEDAFKKEVKTIAKARFPGKIWVGDGDRSEFERIDFKARREAGQVIDRHAPDDYRFEAIAIKPEWHYLNAVMAKYPNAHKRVSTNGKEVKLYLSLEEFKG